MRLCNGNIDRDLADFLFLHSPPYVESEKVHLDSILRVGCQPNRFLTVTKTRNRYEFYWPSIPGPRKGSEQLECALMRIPSRTSTSC